MPPPIAWRQPQEFVDFNPDVLVYCGRYVSAISNQFIREKQLEKKRRKAACCVSFWKRKFENIDIDNEVYLMAFTVTKEIRLQVLQWKIIHNIYPTQILLCKIGKSANSNCKYCNEKDFLEHFFCTCPAVKLI